MRPRVNVSRLLACPPSLGWAVVNSDNLNAIYHGLPVLSHLTGSLRACNVRRTLRSFRRRHRAELCVEAHSHGHDARGRRRVATEEEVTLLSVRVERADAARIQVIHDAL
jgi:hypothetical protein